MAEKITNERLNKVVERLNRMAGTPMEPFTKQADGTYKPNAGNYHIDFAYGGVALDQMSFGGGSGTVNIIQRTTKRNLYDQLFAFISGYEACEILVGHEVKKNPRGPSFVKPNVADSFSLDHWSASKAAELNNAVRNMMKTGLSKRAAIAHLKKETVAGPKVWKAVNQMLKAVKPKRAACATSKRVKKKTQRTVKKSRRVTLTKPNPVARYVVVCVRPRKKAIYYTGVHSIWETDIKKAKHYATEADAKRVAVAQNNIANKSPQRIIPDGSKFGYKKI